MKPDIEMKTYEFKPQPFRLKVDWSGLEVTEDGNIIRARKPDRKGICILNEMEPTEYQLPH